MQTTRSSRKLLITAISALVLIPVVFVSARFSASTGELLSGLSLDQQAFRPTPIPDRIILTWAGDPAHSQAVTWRTDTSVASGLAQLALAEDGPLFTSKTRDVPATTALLSTDLNPAHYHSVRFEDLVPRTKYLYRVGDGRVWSEWIQFRTASDKPEPFSFVYFGDAQNDIKSHWSRVIREAYSDAPRMRFLIHAGDLINHANRDAEWGEWFEAGGWINAMIPNVPTPGNHEYDKTATNQLALSGHWRPQFTLPENGPEGLLETVYWFDYQGMRIISLNSNERQEQQSAWLETVLSNNPNAWTIVTYHHPLYSAAKSRDNATIRKFWQPLFDKYHVDLVLQGHDHTYARSDLLTAENAAPGANLREPRTGTVYVISVSGPKMYDVERRDFLRRVAEDTQLYQVISLDGATLKYEARTATGELYDAFELRKQAAGINQLVEQIPATPERTRPAKAAKVP